MSGKFVIYPVNKDGTLYYSDGYPDAVLTDHKFAHNGMGDCKFTMPDIATHTFDGILTEIQIWKDGAFFDWLICVRATSDGEQVKVECKDLLWPFHREVFGRANRVNHTVNGSFEADAVGSTSVTGWTAYNCSPEIINSNFELGTKAVRLTNPTADADAFLYQDLTETTGPEGLYGLFTAWFFIETMTSPALEQRGIYTDTTLSVDPAWYPITMSQPTGVWTREQSAKQMAGSVTDTFQRRLYCPQGSIVYDAVSFIYEDSISTPFPAGEDQATLLAVIVAYAQNPAEGKFDLNMGVSMPLTGVQRALSYQFVNHENILDKMMDFTKYVDGVDIGLTFVIPSLGSALCQRLVTTWAIVPGGSPGRGSLRTDLTANLNQEIVAIQYQQDGETTSSSVIEMSTTSDPAREEGGAIDTSDTGGRILEIVEQAPESAPINTLDNLANQKLQEVKSKVAMPQLTLRNTYDPVTGAVIKDYGTLVPGDQLPVNANTGGFTNIAETLRVVEIARPAPEDDKVRVTLNRVTN